jgi:arsenate reductase
MSKRFSILFLCVANSARSQLAEGLGKALLGNRAVIWSAGSRPSGKVQPWAFQVLLEEGIDISTNWSKSISELPKDFLDNLDYVITLCAEEVCPNLQSNAKRLHWPISDPAAVPEDKKQEAFRAARNQIRERLQNFISEIDVQSK